MQPNDERFRLYRKLGLSCGRAERHADYARRMIRSGESMAAGFHACNALHERRNAIRTAAHLLKLITAVKRQYVAEPLRSMIGGAL